MDYHSSSFGVEESWNENLSKGLKVEISLKIKMSFLSFVNLCAVQKSEQIKLYL